MSGCRPIELKEGVLIRINEGLLVIQIRGAKVDIPTGRGQPLRELTVETATPWGLFLINHLENIPNHKALIKYNAGGVSERLREKSRRLWPRRKTLISAYSFRHFLGKAMKEDGESKEKIAYALGHAADYAQTVYGRPGGSKKNSGGHGIIKATASNKMRHSVKSDRLNRFTQNKAPKND